MRRCVAGCERNKIPLLSRGGVDALKAQTGWCWSSSIKFLDQHHPGASRHPSSAEEGNFLFHSFGLKNASEKMIPTCERNSTLSVYRHYGYSGTAPRAFTAHPI